MSTIENGLPVKIDSKLPEVCNIINTDIPDSLNLGTSTTKNSDGYSKTCNRTSDGDAINTIVDGSHECEDTSPDISLSSQNTLRYRDVEPEVKEHDSSQTSSDSTETLEASHSEIAKNVSKKPSLAQNIVSCVMDSADKQEFQQKEESGLADHSDSIPELNSASRPESLSLVRPLQDTAQERNQSDSKNKKHTHTKNSRHSSEVKVKTSSKSSHQGSVDVQDSNLEDSNVISLPQNLPQGTITRKGDMIQFVADDLMEKIKKSSPVSHADTASTGSRRSSVRSSVSASSSTSFATSSGVSRSPSSLLQQSPDDIPPIDASAVIDLENSARRVADSIDLMMGNIRNNLHKMSAITIGCQDAYKRSVDITCDSVDASIKSMYALMAKCEELNSIMKPVEQLAVQIKEIKRILDLFEAQMTDK